MVLKTAIAVFCRDCNYCNRYLQLQTSSVDVDVDVTYQQQMLVSEATESVCRNGFGLVCRLKLTISLLIRDALALAINEPTC